MNKSFKEGYDFFVEYNKSYIGGQSVYNLNQPYLDNIEKSISALTEAMNGYKGNRNPGLNGYLAEEWHAHTFNIDAAAKRTGESAHVLSEEVHNLGSSDVGTSWGEEYGLKYYKTGEESAYKQAVSIEDRYRAFIRGKESPPSREEYLASKGLDPKTDMSLPLYGRQARLIPSDQIEDAIKELKRRIAHDSSNPDRVQWVQRYQETLNKLTDHIESPNGAQSMQLSQNDSKVLQTLSKEGKFDPKRFDITLADKADKLFLCENALKAGINAAWISALLKAVPKIVDTIKYLVKEGYVTESDITEIGKKLYYGGTDGFLKGVFCAVITTSAELGYMGVLMQEASHNVSSFAPGVAVAVVLIMQTVQNGMQMAKGEISKQEFYYRFEKSTYIAVSSVGMGIALQSIIPIPMVSYMLGSMLGAVLGGLIFEAKECFFISLCIEKGYTFFGLVEQEYKLPLAICKKLGFDTFEYESFEYESFKNVPFEYESFEYEPFNYEKLDIVMLKRGVIGIRKVGYKNNG